MSNNKLEPLKLNNKKLAVSVILLLLVVVAILGYHFLVTEAGDSKFARKKYQEQKIKECLDAAHEEWLDSAIYLVNIGYANDSPEFEKSSDALEAQRIKNEAECNSIKY